MSKVSEGNFFEHFTLYQEFVHATPRTIGEGEVALYIALTGARQPLPSAAPIAKTLGYLSRPVDDLLAFHIAFGNTVADISLNALANLGYAEVRFLRPVYVGDTLTTRSTVIGLKQTSKGNSGVVYVRSTAQNQHHQEVLTWVRWVMVHKRDLSAPAPETHIPTLSLVARDVALSLPTHFDGWAFDTRWTGGRWLWEDYAVGERINHPSGMTVSNSDHTLATKLYQNNARLHFDALMMKHSPFGQRLMYGGHVISVCRALSYEGLENVLSIASINAGTHSNPSFGGDTFYAYSEVLDKWPATDRQDVGLLRLRLVGLRDAPATTIASAKQDDKYRPEVVLDLDYNVLMPRKVL